MKKCFRLLMAFAIVAVLFSCKKENLDPVELKFSVNPTSLVFPRASQGAKTVTVTSNVDWTVTCKDLASADKGWVVVHPLKGTGDGTFTVNVLDNETNAPRTSTISVVSGDKKIEIALSQTKSEIHLDKGAAEVAASGGTVVTNVTANEAWTVVAPEGFEAAPAAGTGSEAEPVAVTITVSANQGGLSRTANVIFRITEDIADTLTISQGRVLTPAIAADSTALIAVYNAADGANWKADKVWDLSKPIYEWYGVKTDAESGRVTEIKFSAANTITSEWTLPTEIGNLTELTDLRLNSQAVKGEIPASIYGLTKLKSLYLSKNQLSGSLSESLGLLTNLENLYVDQNATLSGPIPQSIGNLTKLVNINIAKTGINGKIPLTMTSCAALQNFMAYETQLTDINDNWDEYPSLKIIQLYGISTLECPLPASIGNAAKLTSIQMKNGNFTGNVPESWANLPTTCNQVYINGNKLSGILPAAFMAHANYSVKWKPSTNIFPQQEGFGLAESASISLDSRTVVAPAAGGEVVVNVTADFAWNVVAPQEFVANPASGTGKEGAPVAVTVTVPANHNFLPRTSRVIFRITEEIADTLTVTQGREITPEMKADSLALIAIYNAANGANWKADKVWDLSKPFYNWSGVTTSETTGRVTALKITAASTITSEWELPTEIGNLTELTDLRFNGQNVKGALPDAICNLTKLKNLYFQNNKLSGSLPVNLGKLTELTAFYIDRNASLEGSLPESMGNLTKLANLNIAKTSISGTVPSTMKNCASLKNFMADATKLTGIGDNWDEYPAIEIIQFINTPTLEGSLPASIGKSKTVKTVQLYNCNFTGNVPEDWGSLPTTCTKLQIYNNKLQGVLPAAFVAHANYGTWNATVNIYPQQEGYILTPPVDAGTEVH